MSEKRATIRDIALAAGVSKSTVANALKGSPEASKATQARIQTLAREMGYRTNPLVAAHFANVRKRNMAGSYQATLAYLSDAPASVVSSKTDKLFPAYHGAKERAGELGFRLDVLSYTSAGLTWERLRKILLSRGIHGLVFAPHQQSQVHLDFAWEDFSVAMIGGTITHPKYHRIEFDHLSNMDELYTRLRPEAHERIGLALPGSFDERVRHQFRFAHDLFLQRLPPAHRIPSFISKDWSQRSFLEWFEMHQPSVIVTVLDDVRQWLKMVNKRVPDDVRLISPVALDTEVEYTGFHLPLAQLARAAVDAVAGQLYRNERGIPATRSITMIMGQWKNGRTS